MIRRKKDETNFSYYNRLRAEASRLGLPQGRGMKLEDLEELVKNGSGGRRKRRSSSTKKKPSSTKTRPRAKRASSSGSSRRNSSGGRSRYGDFLNSDWWD